MKIQIRRSVFETNSSSVHSISIIDDSFNGTLPTEFEIPIDGEFGWENVIYETPSERAAYLWQAIKSYPNGKYDYKNVSWISLTLDEQVEMYQKLVDKFIANFEQYGINVIMPYRTAKIVESSYTKGYFYVEYTDEDGNTTHEGYLDHGSEAREFVDYVLDHPEKMISWIFDNRSYVCCGNDNQDDEDFCDCPDNGPAIEFSKGN